MYKLYSIQSFKVSPNSRLLVRVPSSKLKFTFKVYFQIEIARWGQLNLINDKSFAGEWMHWTRSFRRKLVRLRKCSFRFTSIRWKTEIDAASRRLHQPQSNSSSSSSSSGRHNSNLRSLRYTYQLDTYQATNVPISGSNLRLLHHRGYR